MFVNGGPVDIKIFFFSSIMWRDVKLWPFDWKCKTACSGLRAELGTECRSLVGGSNGFRCHSALVALTLPAARLMSLTKFFVLF